MTESKWIAGIVLSALALMSIGSKIVLGQTFYVEQNSKAKVRDGSQKAPFQTLEEARDAVRKLSSKKAVQIIVGKGTWYLENPVEFLKEDSGTESDPVIWRASSIGETTLSGGKIIPASEFKPLDSLADLDRIHPNVKDKILFVDLNRLGVSKLDPLGIRSQMPLNIPELFVDGKRMMMAKWPNEGWATIDKILVPGSKANSGNAFDAAKKRQSKPEPPKGGSFSYSGDRPARWNTEKGVWLHGYWCFDWASEVIKVASIDKEKKAITLASQHVYGLRQGNPSPRRWMAIHLLEELDVPGEYYYDQEKNRLYFYPKDDLQKSKMILAWKSNPVVRFKGVSHLVFKGFNITDSFLSGISAKQVRDLRIEKCTIRNTRKLGISLNDASQCVIQSCLLEQTGTGGISISGGDRRTLTPSNNLVENNIVRSFSQHRLCYANGLQIGGVGITARHNEFYDAPHQAISLGANDCVFEYNIIHHVCLTGDDCGALYKGRNPSVTGNVIRYNFWYDIGSPRGHGNAAIYFDDGDVGEKVYGNVFLRTGEPGKGRFGSVFSHGGHGHLVENNIFIDCKRPLGSSPWNDKRWKEYIDAPLWQYRLLKEVNITDPVYTKHYPFLIGFMNGAPAEKRRNFAKGNVFVNSKMKPTGNWVLDDSNWTTEDDPGFVDAAKNDFRLKPDSEIYKKIRGFQPIPFEKIGPYKD